MITSDEFDTIYSQVNIGKTIKQACKLFGKSYDYYRHNASIMQRQAIAELKNQRTGEFKIKEYSTYKTDNSKVDKFILASY